MSKKNNNKVKVSFPWYSSDTVTGSAVLVETDTKKILIEFGLHQENCTLLEDYRFNSKKIPFKPKEIDYIFVLHCHIDHIGLIPRLYKEGCRAKIIAPMGNKELFKTMCLDSAHILEKNSQDLTSKFKKEFSSIYDSSDVFESLNYWDEFNFLEKIKIDEDLEFQFLHSSHIINSAQAKLWVKNKNRVVSIGITSDLGNIGLKEQYYVETFNPIDKSNLLIMETTYGDKTRRQSTQKDRKKDIEKLESIVLETCIDKRGKILIPVFALQRSQTILTCLYEIFKERKDLNFTVLLDSPLFIKLNGIFLQKLPQEQADCFREVLNWDKIQKCEEFSTTREWLENKEPCIFLSCSGMMTAGRSVEVCKKLLKNARNSIVFVGYSTEGSLAYKLKQKKQKTVKIDNVSVPCCANVVCLNSFSSHIQYPELIKYATSGNFDKIALVHGDFDVKTKFSNELQEELKKKNKTSLVICVNKSTTINL